MRSSRLATKTRYCSSASWRDFARRETRALQHEAALRADRHDQPVLQLLRAHQAEHLDAQVVEAIAPAQPSARDRPAAQMDALQLRRVHEDLAPRPRRRDLGHQRRVDLEGDAVRRRLLREEVRAQRREHQRVETRERAIFVERRDAVAVALEGALQTAALARAALAASRAGSKRAAWSCTSSRTASGFSSSTERRNGRVSAALDLEEVLEIGAHAVDFAPREPGAEHEAVQRIARDGARQHGADRVAEALRDRVEIGLRRRRAAARAASRPSRAAASAGVTRSCCASTTRMPKPSMTGSRSESSSGSPARKMSSVRDLAPLVAVVEVEREVRDARRGERLERDDAAHRVDRDASRRAAAPDSRPCSDRRAAAPSLSPKRSDQRGLEAVLPARRQLLDLGLEPRPDRAA